MFFHENFRLIAAFLTASLVTSAVPNGLCLLTGSVQGRGHGFVVGEFLFTSAHVVQALDGNILADCYQDGRWVPIAVGPRSSAVLHPRYSSAEELIGPDWSAALEGEKEDPVSWLFDLAYLPLEQPAKSDFLLDRKRIRKRGTLPRSAVFDPENEAVLFQRTIKKGWNIVRRRFLLNTQAIRDKDVPVSPLSTFFLETSMPSVGGYSGSPLYRRVGRNLLVMGIRTGDLPNGRTIFSAVSLWPDSLSEEHPHLFYKPDPELLKRRCIPRLTGWLVQPVEEEFL